MFDVAWILAHAVAYPSPAASRRPGLVRAGQRGKPIEASWELPSRLQSFRPRHAGDVSALDSSSPDNPLPERTGQPGSLEWALLVATIDRPAVAIPLARQEGVDAALLLRVYEGDGEAQRTLVSLELTSTKQGRGRQDLGGVRAISIETAAEPEIELLLRERMEEAYLAADPEIRNRILSTQSPDEPCLLWIAQDRAAEVQARAAAATFGLGVHRLHENIARDAGRLNSELDGLGSRLRAVALLEAQQQHALVWVADQIRSLRPQVLVETVFAEDLAKVRPALRDVLAVAVSGGTGTSLPLELPTCSRCQPDVTRVLEAERLAVGTRAAIDDELCVCEGVGYQNRSLRFRIAIRLHADVGELLLIGYQDDFDSIIGSIAHVGVRHIENAGDPDAAAARTDLAIVVSGSRMGHSDSGRYLTPLDKRGVRVISTSGNQLSDVMRLLIDDAVQKRPDLRR